MPTDRIVASIFLQSCCLEQLLQVSLANARKIGFVCDLRVERARRFPECAERALPAGMIPDTGRDNAPRACHARHLGQPGDSISHEVNDELRQDRVEGPLRKRQMLRRRSYNLDAGKAFSSRANELLRRINGGHGGRAESLDQLSGECAGAAADVQGALIDRHLSKGRQLRSERNGVASHESVVRLSGDSEAHGRIVRRASRS